MKYVVIGASAAGISAAREIRNIDQNGEIIMVSEDDQVYSRCMLHHVISGKRTGNSTAFIDSDFFKKNNIEWLRGVKVTDIHFSTQEIVVEHGKSISYDRLLIATGSKATLPPIKGLADSKNVFKLRDMSDVNGIIKTSENAQSALVIGAGLVGLDAASGLLERGLNVTVVEMADRILPLQLDDYSADNYRKLFEKAGVKIHTGVSVSEAFTDASGFIESVSLNNGEKIECQMIVAAAGVRPNTEFIKDNTLKIDRGIVINDRMETSVSNVFAAGDVTGKSAIWPSAVKQGMVAASNMAGIAKHMDDYFTAKNTINLLGLESASMGLIDPPDPSYSVDIFSRNGVYKKIIHKDGVVYGVILQKDISRCGFWTHVIKEKQCIGHLSKSIFDLSFADFFSIDNNGNYKYAHI